jgi:hypothetical protein
VRWNLTIGRRSQRLAAKLQLETFARVHGVMSAPWLKRLPPPRAAQPDHRQESRWHAYSRQMRHLLAVCRSLPGALIRRDRRAEAAAIAAALVGRTPSACAKEEQLKALPGPSAGVRRCHACANHLQLLRPLWHHAEVAVTSDAEMRSLRYRQPVPRGRSRALLAL